MTDKSVRVEVHGLKEFERAIRTVDKELKGELKDALRAIATRVADDARSRVDSRTGRAASSVKPRASSQGASIAFGGSRAEYFPWLDFGGTTGRGHKDGPGKGSIKREWKGKPGGDGRYVYPAIKDNRQEIAREVDEAVEKVAKSADFETQGSGV